jgi:hypothetical protein
MKTIDNIILFMERVPLKGSEVPAFIECMQYLNIAKQQLTSNMETPNTNNYDTAQEKL